MLLVLLVKKPGGSIYICIDYRGINNIILKIRYLLPLIKETFDVNYKITIFIKFNIIAAFNKIRVKRGYEWLMVFIIRFGLYESLVYLFGL